MTWVTTSDLVDELYISSGLGYKVMAEKVVVNRCISIMNRTGFNPAWKSHPCSHASSSTWQHGLYYPHK